MDQIDNNSVGQTVVEDTTQVTSPTTKEPTTGTQTTEGLANQPSVPVEPKFQSEEERKAFQEMRLENKRLKEEVAARQSNESAFQVFKPQPVNVNPQQFNDPVTGEFNQVAYTQAELQKVKAEASQAARDEIDEFQARQKYPEIFADRETEEIVASQWFASKMRGENVTVTQIADRFAKRWGKAVTQAEKVGAQKALQQVTPKEQAALAATGQTGAAAQLEQSDDERRRLSEATRFGKEDAITARMSKIPWANK